MKHLFSSFVIIIFSLGIFLASGTVVRAAALDANKARVSGLSGTYYDATGAPLTRNERNSDIVAIRNDAVISFQWNETSPPPVASEFFTAEWSGELQPPTTGTYSFAIIGDGAAALWINDDLLIEEMPSELTRRTAGVYEYAHKKGLFFEVGSVYNIRVKTRHSRNNGLAQLWWRKPNGVWEIIPSEYFFSDAPAPSLPTGNGKGVSASLAQYFDNTIYRVSRTDSAIQVDFPSDFQNKGNVRFDVSWSGEIEPRRTTFYRFYTSADGPMEFSLQGEDGQAQITTTREGAQDAQSESVFLLAGKRYPFTASYHNYDGVTRSRLMWSNALSLEKELIPRSQLFAPLIAQKQPKKQGTGLAGFYYNGEQFEQRVFSRTDPIINFSWKKNSPKPKSVNADHFSVQWEGEIEATTTDFYQFSSTVDDRIKIIMDGNIILDTSRVRAGKTNHTLPLLLLSGQRYPLRIEYAEYVGSAYVNLLWSGSDGKRVLVPQESLYSATKEKLKKIAQRQIAERAGEGTGLRAEYFSDIALTALQRARIDSTVDFNWGTASPFQEIPANNFSARWSGWIMPRSTENYTFTTRTDDGVRLWIGEKDAENVAYGASPLVNDWRPLPLVERFGSVSLEAGHRYPIVMEYFERTEDAAAQLFWSTPTREREIIPRAQLYPKEEPEQPAGSGSGLRGRYYAGRDTSGKPALPYPALERIDPFIDVNWGQLGPHDNVPADNFSVLWEGFLQPRYSGTTTFYLFADDDAKLFIDERPITTATVPLLTNGSDTSREYSAIKNLSRDRIYYIKIVYRENIGDAHMRFSWSHARIPKEVVPRFQLYPPSMSILAPLGL